MYNNVNKIYIKNKNIYLQDIIHLYHPQFLLPYH